MPLASPCACDCCTSLQPTYAYAIHRFLYFGYLLIEIEQNRSKSIKINHNRTKSIITINCVIDFYRFPIFVNWLVSTTINNDWFLSTIEIIDMLRPDQTLLVIWGKNVRDHLWLSISFTTTTVTHVLTVTDALPDSPRSSICRQVYFYACELKMAPSISRQRSLNLLQLSDCLLTTVIIHHVTTEN